MARSGSWHFTHRLQNQPIIRAPGSHHVCWANRSTNETTATTMTAPRRRGFWASLLTLAPVLIGIPCVTVWKHYGESLGINDRLSPTYCASQIQPCRNRSKNCKANTLSSYSLKFHAHALQVQSQHRRCADIRASDS